jgi:UDP-3-O-[3-hydroxymyristoyl] N-acetylglucosamine deacetylase
VKIFQKTIKKKITFSGITLHTGVITTLTLLPAKINSGIVFVRTDQKKHHPILAKWSNVQIANLCTVIRGSKGISVSTIEHLMFAFYVLGITNIIAEVDGPEIPILDGSSIEYINNLKNNGLTEQKIQISSIKINKSIEVVEGSKFIKYEPKKNDFLEVEYTLDYNDQFIKKQSKIIKNIQKNYQQIYNARTFCHQEDLEKIFAMGLAKGGSLENAIVISGNRILNQDGLRYEDEFVRHKILDCVGDLYLSGFFLNGKIICYQGGHELTHKLIKRILLDKKNYTIEKFEYLKDKTYTTNKSNKRYKLAI